MNRIARLPYTSFRRRLCGAGAAVWIAAVSVAAPATAQGVSKTPQNRAAEHPKPRPDVARFRARLNAVLGQATASRLNWGIEVADRDTGDSVFELNGDHFCTPASNAKIVTTALALATLGADYRFQIGR